MRNNKSIVIMDKNKFRRKKNHQSKPSEDKKFCIVFPEVYKINK